MYSGRILSLVYLLIGIQLSCKPLAEESELEGITGFENGRKVGFTLIAVRPHTDQSISARPSIALVECNDRPDYWLQRVEAAAAAGVAYLNMANNPPQVYIPIVRDTPDPTPCTVLPGAPNIDIETLRVTSRKAEAAVRATNASTAQKDAYFVAQTFFLAMRGAYGEQNFGAKQMIQYAQLMGVTTSYLVGFLRDRDPFYNPCFKQQVESVPQWIRSEKDKHFFCDKPGALAQSNYGVKTSGGKSYKQVKMDLVKALIENYDIAHGRGPTQASLALAETVYQYGEKEIVTNNGQSTVIRDVAEKQNPGFNETFKDNNVVIKQFAPGEGAKFVPDVAFSTTKDSLVVGQMNNNGTNFMGTTMNTNNTTNGVQHFSGDNGSFANMNAATGQFQSFVPAKTEGIDGNWLSWQGVRAGDQTTGSAAFLSQDKTKYAFRVANGGKTEWVTGPITNVDGKLQFGERDQLASRLESAMGNVGIDQQSFPAYRDSYINPTLKNLNASSMVEQNKKMAGGLLERYNAEGFVFPENKAAKKENTLFASTNPENSIDTQMMVTRDIDQGIGNPTLEVVAPNNLISTNLKQVASDNSINQYVEQQKMDLERREIELRRNQSDPMAVSQLQALQNQRRFLDDLDVSQNKYKMQAMQDDLMKTTKTLKSINASDSSYKALQQREEYLKSRISQVNQLSNAQRQVVLGADGKVQAVNWLQKNTDKDGRLGAMHDSWVRDMYQRGVEQGYTRTGNQVFVHDPVSDNYRWVPKAQYMAQLKNEGVQDKFRWKAINDVNAEFNRGQNFNFKQYLPYYNN